MDKRVCNGGITVDRVPVCLVEPHPKCVAVGTCPGSMDRVINPDQHGLLYSPGDALGLPVHYREIVQFYGMKHGVALVIDGEGGS